MVFCGKGLTNNLGKSINDLAIKLKNTNSIVGVTDRGDLSKISFNENVHKIPLITPEKDIPKGIKAENYFFCEIESIKVYFNKLGFKEIKFFTRLRKDIYLDTLKFLNYLQTVPSLNKRYKFITVSESTNILRRFCISDMFFTIPIGYINKFRYRFAPKGSNDFWFKYRHIKPQEIYKNNHQMEQWVWLNLLREDIPSLEINCSLKDYWLFIHKYILVMSPKQIGYLWNRSSDFYFNNSSRFAPDGNGLLKTSKPFRDFFSFSLINSHLLISESKLSDFFHNSRKIYFIKKFIYFTFSLPFYYLKFFLEKNNKK